MENLLLSLGEGSKDKTKRLTPPQGKLGVLGHGIALVQDDQLELVAVMRVLIKEWGETGCVRCMFEGAVMAGARALGPLSLSPKTPAARGGRAHGTAEPTLAPVLLLLPQLQPPPPENRAGGCKVDDLLADDADPAVVRRVELEHHVRGGRAVQGPGDRQDGGRLARPGRTVKHEVGQAGLVHQAADCCCWSGSGGERHQFFVSCAGGPFVFRRRVPHRLTAAPPPPPCLLPHANRTHSCR